MPAMIRWDHCCGLEMTQSIMGQQVRVQLPTSQVLEGGQRDSKEASYFHKCMSPSDLLPPTMSRLFNFPKASQRRMPPDADQVLGT